jgi:hypothetical protein
MSATAKRQRPFRLTQPVPDPVKQPREHQLHKQIADALRLEIAPPGRVSGWGVVWWSIDIADYGGLVPATRTWRGVIAGIPDIFVLWRGRAYLAEVKTPVGVLSPAQQSVMSAVLAGGGHCGVVTDADAMLRLLDFWHIPRSGRTGIVRQAQREMVHAQ